MITNRLLIDVFYHRLVTSGTWSVFECNVACERNCIYGRRLWWREATAWNTCVSRLLMYNALGVRSVWFGPLTFIRSNDEGKFTPFQFFFKITIVIIKSHGNTWVGRGREGRWMCIRDHFSVFLFFTMVKAESFCFLCYAYFYFFSFQLQLISFSRSFTESKQLTDWLQVPNLHHLHWQGLPFVQQSFHHVSSL